MSQNAVFVLSSASPIPRLAPPTEVESLHAVKCIFEILDISSNSSASETIVSFIVDLSFMLIDTIKKDSASSSNFGRSKSAAAATTAKAGRMILKRIFDGVGSDEATLESIRKSIIKKLSLKCTGHAPNALEHSKLLETLCSDSTSLEGMYDFAGDLVEWLGHLTTGGLPPRAATEGLLPCLGKVRASEIIANV